MGSICGRTDDVNPTNMDGIIAETGQESKKKQQRPASRNDTRCRLFADATRDSESHPSSKNEELTFFG